MIFLIEKKYIFLIDFSPGFGDDFNLIEKKYIKIFLYSSRVNKPNLVGTEAALI